MAIALFGKMPSQKESEDLCQRLKPASHNQPKSTKKPQITVPPPQSARIIQRYVAGESIRQIARKETRDRATVTKIVRSEEMNAFVQKMRERYYGLAFDAMDAVEHTLQVQKDGRLGRQLLAHIGVIPSAEERYAMAAEESMNIARSSLTPFEAAITEGAEGQMFQVAYGAACVIEESAKNFDFQLPTPEEIRLRRRVVKVADEITGGRFHEICMADGLEEQRIRQLAEKKVKRQEARRLLPARRIKRALPEKQTARLASGAKIKQSPANVI